MSENNAAKSYYEISRKQLPLYCPMPPSEGGQALWSAHPRVYLPIMEQGGEIACPYCGARYRLKAE